MGQFLAMSGIANAKDADVENALREYAESHGGSMTECEATDETWEFLIMSERMPGRITVAFPGAFMDWDDAAQHLSRSLGVSVFSFHIHDDDLWMYVLYAQGEEVDRFNPIPAYWTNNISDEELQSWKGNAAVIAKHWPVREDAIATYLVTWNLDDDSPGKAYPSDEFNYGNCWQLVDFMKKLELEYPFDDRGGAHGKAFKFEVDGM